MDASLMSRMKELEAKKAIQKYSVSIRCDNGSEYISGALKSWAEKHLIELKYIQPGNPQQNAYIERFNRTVRYDWLSQYLFSTLSEVQDYATQWLWSYNNTRPNMALGGKPPVTVRS